MNRAITNSVLQRLADSLRRGVAVVVVGALLAGCRDVRPTVPIREGQLPLPNGDSLWYAVHGSGPDTIVVVPGGPALSHAYLTAAVQGLLAEHAVVLYDPRGRGRSTAVPVAGPGISSRTDAADLLLLLDSLGLSRPGLVAHHYGAEVLVRLVALAPARVGRTVFVAPQLPHETAIYDLASEVMDTSATRRLADDYRDSLHVRDERTYCQRHWGFMFGPIEEVGERVVGALADSVCDGTPETRSTRAAINSSITTARGVGFRMSDSVRTYAAPLLVVQGDADRIYAFWSRSYAALAPEGRMLELRGSSLFPWLDSQAAFTDALTTFFSGAWPAASSTPEYQSRRPPLDSLPPSSAAL